MTDGVDMSQFRIGQVNMLALDFAGQKEYAHTHALFFKNTAIYLAVFMPRAGAHFSELENFLQMVKDNAPDAPVVLVTTRADESTLSIEEVDRLKHLHPCIINVCAVDSKSGTGIKVLENLLEEIALKQPGTIRKVPKLFFKFKQLLALLAAGGRFSLSPEEFLKAGIEKIKLTRESVMLARDLFDSVRRALHHMTSRNLHEI